MLFKSWARRDETAPAGGRYSFLAVHWGKGHWVLTTDPLDRVPLASLRDALQAAEEKKAGAREEAWARWKELLQGPASESSELGGD